MKKIYKSVLVLTAVIAISGLCAYGAQYTKFSAKFIKNFKDCDKYTETITSEYDSKTFTTERKILGWRNGACKYQEIISSPTEKYQLNCSFGDLQVDELYQAMKSKSKDTERFELDVFAEQKDPKTGRVRYVKDGSTTIIGNKAYVKWAKYQNNPYFCKPQKL